MMMNKKSLFVMALILVLTTVLSGCSKSNKGEEAKGNLSGDTTSSQNDTKPNYGGSIVVGITQDLDSLDPHKAVAAGTKEVLCNIFDGLVKVSPDGELVPAVASKYEISDDALTYTFTLRDGVKFHNGEPVTVDDVIYSIKRCAGLLEEKDPSIKQISALSIIKEVNAVDDSTIEVVLSEPNIELIGYMTFAIIPKDYKDQDTFPIGTGPFKFVSYEPLGSIVMEKNEDYYMEGVPYLDKVTFKISANTDAAFPELLSGAIDIFPYLTETQASQLTNAYNVEVGSCNLVNALFLNNVAAPFDDIRVRQALCYAINRQDILNIVAGGKGSIIGSNMFPGFKEYYDDTLVDQYAYNVDKAKDLLKEDGYPDGFTFTITVPSSYQVYVDMAQVIVEQLKSVGITAKIQLIEWASWLSDVYMGREYEATIIGLDGELAPSDIMYRYNSDAKNNFMNYKNEEYDRIYKLAAASIDQKEKVDYYKQLQKILADDAAAVYIQDPAKLVAVNKKLGGYTFYPVYVMDMSTIYYTEAVENK